MADLRVKKTKKAIENALMALIEKKGYANVRLVEIAELADVNRNTIYLHYKSKEDIIISIVEDAFPESFHNADYSWFIKNRMSRHRTEGFFQELFKIFNGKIELYRILLTDPNLSGYIEKVFRNIRTNMKKQIKNTPKNDLAIDYMVNGIYGIVKRWIIYAPYTLEENVKALTELVMSTFRHIQVI